MKNIVVLDSKTLGNVDYSKLEEFGTVTLFESTEPNEVNERIKDANIVLTNKVVLGEENLSSAKNLELICETATGFNNIDVKSAKENNIAVTNVAGYSTDTVAQHTFATLLHLYSKLAYYDNFVKSGEYSRSGMFTSLDRPYHEVSGKRWGIVGLGNIGKKVASIATAFGAEVFYYSTSGRNNDSIYKRVDKEELLQTCDIISIHAPLNDNTNNLFNYDAFTKMKKNAVLVNVGRGPIVSNEDLARALNENLIEGAAIDVFVKEPVDINNPLLNIDDKEKLVLTPHTAWASIEAIDRLFTDLLENIRAFYRGEVRNRVEL